MNLIILAKGKRGKLCVNKGGTLNNEKLISVSTKYANIPKHNSTKNSFNFSLFP